MACWALLALLAAEGPKLALLDAAPAAEAPGDDALKKLLKARYNCAVEEVRYYHALQQAGRATAEAFYAAGRRLTDAQLDLCDTPAERVACLERFVELTRAIDILVEARFKAGGVSGADREAARGRVLDAEVRLERARRAAKEGDRP